MKRSGPLRRRTGLRRVPFKVSVVDGGPAGREGVNTARQRGAARRREDAAWRVACLELRGAVCRCCGSVRDVQVDHMVGRVAGDRLALGNGLPLCGDFGDGRCHPRKTARRLLIQRSWLDFDQVVWLRVAGHAVWETDGIVSGRHCKIFAPII